MTKSQNPEIAKWARELWERALESERGLEIEYSSNIEAQRARFALYTARNTDRNISREIFPPESPQHGRSLWDAFRVTLEGVGKNILRITHHSSEGVKALAIREL